MLVGERRGFEDCTEIPLEPHTVSTHLEQLQMEVHMELWEAQSKMIGHSRARAVRKAPAEVLGTPARSLDNRLPVCLMEPPAQDAGVYA